MTLNVSKEVSADFLSQPVNLLLFRLGRQTFALTIEHIIQIIPMLKLTPVPQVEQIIEGVANIHGKVTPILSARRSLGMPEIAFDLDTPIVLCEANHHSMGLIVDEVLDVISILESQIAPTKSLLPNGVNTTRSISGVIYQGERMILLLSPEFLLRPGQVHAIEQVIDALPPVQAQPITEPAESEEAPFIEETPAPASFEQPDGGLAQDAVEAFMDDAFPGSQEPVVAADAADADAAVTEAPAPTAPEADLPAVAPEPQLAAEVTSVEATPETVEEKPHAAPRQNGKKSRANGKRAAKQASAKKTSASSEEIIAGHLAAISWDMPPVDCNSPEEPEDNPGSQTDSDN